jgi:LysM repeat protein
MQRSSGLLTLFVLTGVIIVVGCAAIVFALLGEARPEQRVAALQASDLTASPTATETIPPYTPLPSLTPSQTLLPPPTFEPPTATPQPSASPTITATPVYEMAVSIPGLHGAETATPTGTPGCAPREDWKLTYTVQANDALAKIADAYNAFVNELAEGNCLADVNMIRVGQELRVPGEAHPAQPEYVCTAWEVLTPFNGSQTVPGDGNITFNWRGPVSDKYLIRITRPDGTQYERVVELRMNDQMDVSEYLRDEGVYTWYVYPLDENFAQIPCLEGGPWTFYKYAAATYTPVPEVNPVTGGGTAGS